MIPNKNYGCLEIENLSGNAEELKRNGYCILDAGYDSLMVKSLQEDFQFSSHFLQSTFIAWSSQYLYAP